MEQVRCVMLDLDGTVYLGDRIFPYTLEFLKLLEKKKIGYLFLTNNSSKGVEEYLQKFSRMGIETDETHLLISTHAAADYLHKHYPGKRVLVLGTESMKKELVKKGISLSDDAPEVCLAGFDTSLNYENLTRFCNFVAEGLPYIATHPDKVCPAEHGFLPDLGGFMALIETCTGRKPEVICGKPNEQILAAAETVTGFDRSQLLMVGDRLMTDIAIGAWGVRTCLVLSGEARKEEIPGAPVPPTYVFENILELGRALPSVGL